MQDQTFRLTPDIAQLPVLRQEISEVLRAGGWTDDDMSDVLLVASELVTNALVHARTFVELRCLVDGEVLLEVADRDPGHLPQVRLRGDEPGGMGLVVVEHLARSWVVTRSEGRKVVRAVLGRPGANGRSP